MRSRNQKSQNLDNLPPDVDFFSSSSRLRVSRAELIVWSSRSFLASVEAVFKSVTYPLISSSKSDILVSKVAISLWVVVSKWVDPESHKVTKCQSYKSVANRINYRKWTFLLVTREIAQHRVLNCGGFLRGDHIRIHDLVLDLCDSNGTGTTMRHFLTLRKNKTQTILLPI